MKRQFNNILFMWLSVMTMLLLVCSCASYPQGSRVRFVKEYDLSGEMLPLVEGKWRNIPKKKDCYYGLTLWAKLTREQTAQGTEVELKKSDKHTLTASLFYNGEVTDSQTFKFREKPFWLKLSKQYYTNQKLWYIVWVLEDRDVAFGIDTNGNLCVNNVGGGVLMFGILPTPFAGGGGAGNVDLHERVE
jgi:hypothetical protein